MPEGSSTRAILRTFLLLVVLFAAQSCDKGDSKKPPAKPVSVVNRELLVCLEGSRKGSVVFSSPSSQGPDAVALDSSSLSAAIRNGAQSVSSSDGSVLLVLNRTSATVWQVDHFPCTAKFEFQLEGPPQVIRAVGKNSFAIQLTNGDVQIAVKSKNDEGWILSSVACRNADNVDVTAGRVFVGTSSGKLESYQLDPGGRVASSPSAVLNLDVESIDSLQAAGERGIVVLAMCKLPNDPTTTESAMMFLPLSLESTTPLAPASNVASSASLDSFIVLNGNAVEEWKISDKGKGQSRSISSNSGARPILISPSGRYCVVQVDSIGGSKRYVLNLADGSLNEVGTASYSWVEVLP